MKTQRAIPALLLTITLSLTLFGCTDNSSNASNATNSPANQPTSNSGSASASGAASSNAGSGNLKLTVVKYNLVTQGNLNYYIGLVRNDGNASVMQTTMHLVDDSGKTVSDDQAQEGMLRQVPALPPGQSVGFKMAYQGGPIQHPQFTFELQPVNMTPVNLTIANSALTNSAFGVADVAGEITIAGEVTNNSNVTADFWSVNAIGYDGSGKVVDVSSGEAADSSQKLTGHTTIKFVVNLLTGNAKIAKYDLFASGLDTSGN